MHRTIRLHTIMPACATVCTLVIVLLSLSAAARDAAASPPQAWWRVFGHLHSADGRRFDFSVSFFRFALPRGAKGDAGVVSAWRGAALVPATFIIVDERTRRAYTSTRLEREALGLAQFAARRPQLRIGNWSLEGNASPWRQRHFTLHVVEHDVELELEQTPLKPPVRYGSDGRLQTGSCASCSAHEEAYTRLRASGTLELGGTRYALTGTTWLDHESSSHELGPGDVGWDRFAIQLDDGRDVDLRVVRRRDGKPSIASSGIVVTADGRTMRLRATDFSVENPLRTRWRNPRTNIAYPSLWEIFVPRAHLDLAVVPPLQAQEISAADGPAYYDGTIDVERAPAPGGDPGQGYVELTGYGRPLRL